MFFSLGKLAAVMDIRTDARGVLGSQEKPGPCSPPADEAMGVLGMARVRQCIHGQGKLPPGTFNGALLSGRWKPELHELLGIPPSERLLVVYIDGLMGQVIQCAALTEKKFYVMEEAGIALRLSFGDVRHVCPLNNLVTCGDGRGLAVCLNRRATGFLKLVKLCIERSKE